MEHKYNNLKREYAKLEEENRELKEEIAKIKAFMKKKKLSIPHRIMPTELINELFASMPLENAFCLLAKMPNGLLARNVQKMINDIKEEMKKNKCNEGDCGSKLKISDRGFVLKHSGTRGWNSIRAVLPIPSFNLKTINKPTITFYYEVEILQTSYGIVIGICDNQFLLKGKILGLENNSVGIGSKYAMWIDKFTIDFENDNGQFYKGDFVGIGIIHLPNAKMECFATLNGKLLGKIELPGKFFDLQLFATFNLCVPGESIRAHFKKEYWQFKDFHRVLE